MADTETWGAAAVLGDSWARMLADLKAANLRAKTGNTVMRIMRGQGPLAHRQLSGPDTSDDDLATIAETGRVLSALAETIIQDRKAKALVARAQEPEWEEIVRGDHPSQPDA